ncbi:cilia- and flagella-associated protein 251-like [Myzus persicae]|uniref:cilia- and flagella-associated protein 251-like n=1 Tax=Myzus persicae TaxID=13164 RepID=UPI000B932EAC|nr:cilia- and flagella-associated protein 251-like [Myzus persicae]
MGLEIGQRRIGLHIITGNINGDIFFYDQSLLVLYHLNMFVGDAITSISMLDNKIHVENGGGDSSTYEKLEKTTQNHILLVDDSVSECDNSPEVGSDFTTNHDFVSSPFLISTRSCRIFQIDICNKTSYYIFEQCEVEFITALAVNPNRSDIIMGNSIGGLVLYNHRKKKTNIRMAGDWKSKEDHRVTCIKYSPNGNYLCCGRSDGLFQFLDPYSITLMGNLSFKWNESPVQYITFSESSMYMAYTDDLFGIYLYGMIQLQNSNEYSVNYYGCYEVHNKSIRSIVMSEYSSSLMIYSLGADHKIIVLELDKT